MLEKIIKNCSIGILLFSLTTCYPDKKEELYTDPNSLIKYQKTLEDSSGEDGLFRKVEYQYKNGIEAEVTYKKSLKNKSILIHVKKDTNKLLIRGTPKTEPLSGADYFLSFEDRSYKEISFDHFGKLVKVLFENDKIKYKSGDDEYKLIPEFFYGIIYNKLDEIDKDLDVPNHIKIFEGL